MDIESIRKEAKFKKKEATNRYQINVRLDPDLYDAYKSYCAENEINGSEAIRIMIKELINYRSSETKQ